MNPYTDPTIAWAMKTGQLALKVHYRVEKNQLTADNQIMVKNLTVAPTRQNDEVKKKIPPESKDKDKDRSKDKAKTNN